MKAVVTDAAQTQIRHRRRPASGKWIHMMKLELVRRPAPAPIGADERAPALVPAPDFLADVDGDVPPPRLRRGILVLRPSLVAAGPPPGVPPQRPADAFVKDRLEPSVRDLVAERVPHG